MRKKEEAGAMLLSFVREKNKGGYCVGRERGGGDIMLACYMTGKDKGGCCVGLKRVRMGGYCLLLGF